MQDNLYYNLQTENAHEKIRLVISQHMAPAVTFKGAGGIDMLAIRVFWPCTKFTDSYGDGVKNKFVFFYI